MLPICFADVYSVCCHSINIKLKSAEPCEIQSDKTCILPVLGLGFFIAKISSHAEVGVFLPVTAVKHNEIFGKFS